jgi:hypothetical protein
MYCSEARVRGDEFRAIFDLATRVKAFDLAKLEHLEAAVDRKDVELTGAEMRSLLMLALQAKRAALPRRVRALRKKT